MEAKGRWRNIRAALRDDLLIHHFIKISEHIVKVMNQGYRAEQFCSVSVPEPLIMFQSLTGEMLRRGIACARRLPLWERKEEQEMPWETSLLVA